MTNRFLALLFLLLALPCPAAEAPDLDAASVDELAAALTHTNAQTRAAAARLLVERNDPRTEEALRPLVSSLSFRGFDEAKGEALWILHRLGRLPSTLLVEAIVTDGKPALQTNALRLAVAWASAADATNRPAPERAAVHAAVLKRVRDVNPRVRLAALEALAAFPVTEETRAAILDLYPDLSTPAAEAAALAIAAKVPVEFIAAAADDSHAGALTNLVARLAAALDAPAAAQAVITLAAKPDEADPLKRAALEVFVRNSERRSPARHESTTNRAEQEIGAPVWSDDLAAAFRTLFESPSLVSAPALALASRWDTSDTLAADARKLTASLLDKLKEDYRPDPMRAQLAASLLAAHRFDTNILPAVGSLLDGEGSPRLKRKIIEALGATADRAAGKVLLHSLTNLPAAQRQRALAQLLTRADWKLASRATEVLDGLRRPDEQEKAALLAKWRPETDQPGDAKKGKELFTDNCAVCHKFNGEGKDLGPDLTGWGARGPADLLVHILDPDRAVDPAFAAVNIETKDNQSYTGIVLRESKALLVVRDAAGEHDIKPDEIQFRARSRRSLMPEGFEKLGAEGLRDLLAFMVTDEAKFRVLDLSAAFTADSTGGLFEHEDQTDETLPFKKFGFVKAGKVSFEIGNPALTTNGNNLVVLRGGTGFSKTFASKVVIPVAEVRATKLHFLGGVGAGAWPCCGTNKHEGQPVARVTIHHTDGEQEQFILTNGVVFADYANPDADVSGSKRVPGLLARGQVRHFSRALTGAAPIERITLESFDNSIVPVFVAITVEIESSKSKNQSSKEASKPKAQVPMKRNDTARLGTLALELLLNFEL